MKRMLAQILPKSTDPESEPRREETERENTASPSSETVPHHKVTQTPREQHGSHKPEREEVAPQNQTQHVAISETENAAPQKSSASQDQPIPKRGHGGAMPR
jgi:hypothetical protein